MSNLYYNYRAESANNRPVPLNPPSQPLAAQSRESSDHLSAFSTANLSHAIQLRPTSSLSSAQGTTAGFSSPQAWAADQPHSYPTLLPPQAQTSQHQPSLVNTTYPRAETSRTTTSTTMNGTRAAPLSTRRVTQHDDSLFHMMGKAYTDKTTANNVPVSSSAIQVPSAATLDRYQQIRSAAASNVLDPNDFPSLGGGLSGQAGIASGAPGLLNPSATDASTITGTMPGSSSNDIYHQYESMYGAGGYGDGRVKAVDAVTGASAASEFSMHSEDFPALGGNAAPGSIRRKVLGNGPSSSSLLPTAVGGLGAGPPSSGENMNLYDGFHDQASGQSVPLQTHAAVGRGMSRSEQSAAGVPLGRAMQAPGEYHMNHNRANPVPQQHSRNPSLHTGLLQEPNRSPAKTGFLSRPTASGKSVRDDMPVPVGDRIGADISTAFDGGNGRAVKVLPPGEGTAIANGDVIGLSGLPSNASGGRVQSGSSLLTRSAGHQRREETKESGSVLSEDQYGMKGLLRYVGDDAEGTDANMLSIGVDLTMLGLDLNSPEPLHKTFLHPWEGGQGGAPGRETIGSSQKSEEPEYKLPTCYYMQPPALKNSHFTKFQLETLFYVFYNMPRDVLQVLAAIELYNRKWRYHKDLKLWFTCEPEVLQGYERGAYIYFDIKSWEQRPFHDANQSFIQGLMTEEELRSVPMPGQRSAAS